jgi:hypothetical protein
MLSKAVIICGSSFMSIAKMLGGKQQRMVCFSHASTQRRSAMKLWLHRKGKTDRGEVGQREIRETGIIKLTCHAGFPLDVSCA